MQTQKPIVRFMNVPYRRDCEQWALEVMVGLPEMFHDWIDVPVFFIDHELMDFVSGNSDALAVTDKVADNLITAYSGSPPLPKYIYDQLDEYGGVISIGINYTPLLQDEEPEYALKSTLLHEVGHVIYETTDLPNYWPELFKALEEKYGHLWWARYLFEYGPEEGFCELFQIYALNSWVGAKQEALGREFISFLNWADEQ